MRSGITLNETRGVGTPGFIGLREFTQNTYPRLLERGHDFKSDRESTPLYWDYIRFQRETIVGYFAELADYIKEYGRSKGRDVLVSGNFYGLLPHYYPFEPKADILVTEMKTTTGSPSGAGTPPGSRGASPSSSSRTPSGLHARAAAQARAGQGVRPLPDDASTRRRPSGST